ncbi:hypothetical protein D3C87_1382450 [compost metagenome]
MAEQLHGHDVRHPADVDQVVAEVEDHVIEVAAGRHRQRQPDLAHAVGVHEGADLVERA